MVQLTNQNARTAHLLARLEAEIRGTVAEGLSLGEIQDLVSIIVAERPTDEPHGDVPIYDKLPSGLITADEAASKFGITSSTIRTWVQRGHISEMGRLKGSTPRGGKLAVSEAELTAHLASPRNKGGRPRKT